jgi:hypothetical protein
VFRELFLRDPTGAGWLPGLLELGSRATEALPGTLMHRLVSGHKPTWGSAELALPAPLGLLEYLVQAITGQQVAASRDTGPTLARRQLLAQRHPDTIAEALSALRNGKRGRHWFVLEGASRPDATLEMPKAVLLVEGKRTERSCTSTTKWMGTRSQLLRHMDAASDLYRDKRVLGLLLVEGDGGAEALEPSSHWHKESDAQHSPEMLATSLPHRTPAEREAISQGILGVATWQAVCRQNGIPWPPSQSDS